MKKHDTKRKENARRNRYGYEGKLSRGMNIVVNIGSVEQLRNPEFWK